MELCPWAQGWAHRGGGGQEAAGRRDKTKELHPGGGQGRRDPGKGWELQLHRMGSVGGGFSQTVNSSKANKRNTSFEGQKEFMALGQIQQIFLARRGRVLNHHFLNKIFFLQFSR